MTDVKAIDRPAPPSPGEIVDRAAARLAATLETRSAEPHEFARAEARDGLEAVATATRAILDQGGEPEGVAGLLDARTIRSLRASVLALDLPGDASGAVLEVLRALETLLERVLGADQDTLAARLSQPDALQLLVEVAHDLRSPLTSILFLSETLRTGHSGEVNELQRSQLGLIYSAALGLASLASNVIDLAREGRGLIDGDPELYSLEEMVGGVEEMIRPMADEKGLELRIAVPPLEKAHGHPVALGRVLLNLATNALKFTDQGWVEIGAVRRSNTRIEFYVRDTGRGISEERRDELFNPFKKRLYSTGHFFSGSGVGLSIARRLVRAMGSDLELESSEEGGTRFSFTLDVAPPR